MIIAIASDHGGLDLKTAVIRHLEDKGYEVRDFGTRDKASCDYPDFAGPAAKAVASGEAEKGIVICTTGIGVSITANKISGIRCALCHDVTTARLTRLHNDANVLAIGAGVIGEKCGHGCGRYVPFHGFFRRRTACKTHRKDCRI